MINSTKIFPETCNTTRFSIIGVPPKDRAIFALAAIPKIIGTGVKISFDKIKIEDGTMQMAYTANHGAVSCNGISLQEVEVCEETPIQTQQDFQKAFNKAHRPTILNEMQKRYGAGSLIASWFKNPTYTFNGPLRELIRGEITTLVYQPELYSESNLFWYLFRLVLLSQQRILYMYFYGQHYMLTTLVLYLKDLTF